MSQIVPTIPGGQHDAVVRAFLTACETGDAAVITSVLDPAVTAVVDSGGVVRTAKQPVHGVQPVAAWLAAVVAAPVHLAAHAVNGQTGLVLSRDGRVVGVLCLRVRGSQVSDVWLVVNPDKLQHWNR